MNKIQLYFKDSVGKKQCLAAFLTFLIWISYLFIVNGKVTLKQLYSALGLLVVFHQFFYAYLLYTFSKQNPECRSVLDLLRKTDKRIRLVLNLTAGLWILVTLVHLFKKIYGD